MIVTAVFGTLYMAVQGVIRSGADDPQVQRAEDSSARLTAGLSPSAAVGSDVQVRQSLSPFEIVYARDGRILASSARVGDHTPRLPEGVLSPGIAPGREKRFTWEPQPNLRIAAVVVSAPGYFVLSGRSLREVEERESDLRVLVGVAWILSLAVLGATGAATAQTKRVDR